MCVWIVCATHSQHAHSADSSPSFENDIAPILRTYCAGCHNDRDLEGELSVETFGSLRRGGASAVDPIVSGNGAESIMLKRIASDQPDKMPPEDEPQLPKKEIETLARWISGTVQQDLLATYRFFSHWWSLSFRHFPHHSQSRQRPGPRTEKVRCRAGSHRYGL